MSDDLQVFVDTNILVYAFDASDEERQERAERALVPLFEEDRIRLSTQVLQEFYVTMTRKVGRPWSSEEALGVLDDLASWPLVVVDYDLIRESVLLSDEATLSFWDALIVSAAARSGAEILFTEDMNDGQVVRGIRVSNPMMA
jgi:predicted nucleic acid-binding protein